MTLKELKEHYVRLGNEIDALAAEGGHDERRLASLLNELDRVHQELRELRRRTWTAPILRDAVTRPVAVALRSVPRPPGAPELASPLPMAG
jgi:chromosome segregation ATPase